METRRIPEVVTLEVVDGSIAVARHAVAKLSTTHETQLEIDLAMQRFGEVVVTSVVKLGTEVNPGTVLVGRLVPTETAMRDGSLRCAPGLTGTVTAVERDDERIAVTIRSTHALAVGDTLRVGSATGTVIEIVEMHGDVRWPGLNGTYEVETIASASDAAFARSIGPYSLVTNQPLGGKANFGGQLVGEAELAALRASGADHVIRELLTVKSDDIEGRQATYASIVRCTPEVVAAVPENGRRIEQLLRALAFDVDFSKDAVGIGFLDELTQEIVTVADTVDVETLVPVEGGLMCERIFADEREGRIALPAPVFHPLLFAAAARELNVDEVTLQAVLDGERTFEGKAPETWLETGVNAVEARLGDAAARFIYRSWPVAATNVRPIVPLDNGRYAVSDLNDLYLDVMTHAHQLARLIELGAPDIILWNEHQLLQHAVDNLVANGARGVATCHATSQTPLRSLTDMLRREVEQARTKRVDYSAIGVAVPRAELVGQVAVPRELALELWTPFVYGELEHAGVVQRIKQAKALVDARDPRALEVLAKVVAGYPLLLFPDKPTTPAPMAALDVVLWDEPAFGLPPEVFARLGGMVVAHVPIDPRAVAELREPRHAEPRAAFGWIARMLAGSPIDVLIDAARREEIDRCVDLDTRDLLGL